MKESESIKEYANRLMSIINKIKMLREEIPNKRVVEKVLVSLLKGFESKISSLKDSKDLSQIAFVKLINALQMQE